MSNMHNVKVIHTFNYQPTSLKPFIHTHSPLVLNKPHNTHIQHNSCTNRASSPSSRPIHPNNQNNIIWPPTHQPLTSIWQTLEIIKAFHMAFILLLHRGQTLGYLCSPFLRIKPHVYSWYNYSKLIQYSTIQNKVTKN